MIFFFCEKIWGKRKRADDEKWVVVAVFYNLCPFILYVILNQVSTFTILPKIFSLSRSVPFQFNTKSTPDDGILHTNKYQVFIIRLPPLRRGLLKKTSHSKKVGDKIGVLNYEWHLVLASLRVFFDSRLIVNSSSTPPAYVKSEHGRNCWQKFGVPWTSAGFMTSAIVFDRRVVYMMFGVIFGFHIINYNHSKYLSHEIFSSYQNEWNTYF